MPTRQHRVDMSSASPGVSARTARLLGALTRGALARNALALAALARGALTRGALALDALTLVALATLCAPLRAFAAALPTPPTVQLTFAPATIQTGATSRLTITLGNANAGPATLTAPLTDTLPTALKIATPAAIGGSCGAGAVTAPAGGGAVSYAAGATLPAGGCTIQVNVTGASATHNTYYTDSIPAGALQTTDGASTATATSTLTVQAAAAVPKVVGLSQAAAAAALQAAGLTLGAVTKGAGPANIPYDAVFAQTPAAGVAAPAGSAVNISVSTGAGLATNPNQPLTSVPGFVAPYQQSEAAAFERLCATLSTANPTTLSVSQHNLLSNCDAIIGTHGGGVDAAGLKETLDAIGGKQTTAQQRVGVQFAGAQFTNIGARLAQLRQGVSGVSFAGLDLGGAPGSGLGQLFAALEDTFGPGASRDRNPAYATPGGATTGRSMTGDATTGDTTVGDATMGAGTTGGGTTGGGASADPGAPIDATTRLGFFINGSLRRGSQDTTTFETPFDFKATSVTAGVDYRFTSSIILGLALGHSNGSTDFTDGSGRLDSRSNSISLYGTYYNEAFYVDVIGSFAHVTYDATRTTSFSISSDTAVTPTNCVGTDCSVDTTGSTGAKQYAFSTNVGYSFNEGALTWGPDVALNYTRVRVNGFTESDPYQQGLSLVFGEDTGESLLGKVGGHVAYAIKTPYAVILPEARVHYVHEFKNDQRALSVHFSDDPAANSPSGPVSNFVVFTDPPDRGYYDWAAGVSAQFAFGISAFANYNAVMGSDQRVHEVAVGIRIEHAVP